MHKSKQDIHAYWRDPDAINATESYLSKGIGRSVFLLSIMQRFATPKSKILEIGCNAGRNLAFLWHGGFRRLNAVEIYPKAIDNLRRTFPELRRVSVKIGPAEEILKYYESNRFNVVFTMAVLEHIHTDGDEIFKEMHRIARRVIVIEDEETRSERHFPRSYQAIFGNLGMEQIEHVHPVPDLPKQFHMRVFDKKRKSGVQEFKAGWKPIGTAAKSRDFILATDGQTVASVYWSEDDHIWHRADNSHPYTPTHWDYHPTLP